MGNAQKQPEPAVITKLTPEMEQLGFQNVISAVTALSQYAGTVLPTDASTKLREAAASLMQMSGSVKGEYNNAWFGEQALRALNQPQPRLDIALFAIDIGIGGGMRQLSKDDQNQVAGIITMKTMPNQRVFAEITTKLEIASTRTNIGTMRSDFGEAVAKRIGDAVAESQRRLDAGQVEGAGILITRTRMYMGLMTITKGAKWAGRTEMEESLDLEISRKDGSAKFARSIDIYQFELQRQAVRFQLEYMSQSIDRLKEQNSQLTEKVQGQLSISLLNLESKLMRLEATLNMLQGANDFETPMVVSGKRIPSFKEEYAALLSDMDYAMKLSATSALVQRQLAMNVQDRRMAAGDKDVLPYLQKSDAGLQSAQVLLQEGKYTEAQKAFASAMEAKAMALAFYSTPAKVGRPRAEEAELQLAKLADFTKMADGLFGLLAGTRRLDLEGAQEEVNMLERGMWTINAAVMSIPPRVNYAKEQNLVFKLVHESQENAAQADSKLAMAEMARKDMVQAAKDYIRATNVIMMATGLGAWAIPIVGPVVSTGIFASMAVDNMVQEYRREGRVSAASWAWTVISIAPGIGWVGGLPKLAMTTTGAAMRVGAGVTMAGAVAYSTGGTAALYGAWLKETNPERRHELLSDALYSTIFLAPAALMLPAGYRYATGAARNIGYAIQDMATMPSRAQLQTALQPLRIFGYGADEVPMETAPGGGLVRWEAPKPPEMAKVPRKDYEMWTGRKLNLPPFEKEIEITKAEKDALWQQWQARPRIQKIPVVGKIFRGKKAAEAEQTGQPPTADMDELTASMSRDLSAIAEDIRNANAVLQRNRGGERISGTDAETMRIGLVSMERAANMIKALESEAIGKTEPTACTLLIQKIYANGRDALRAYAGGRIAGTPADPELAAIINRVEAGMTKGTKFAKEKKNADLEFRSLEKKTEKAGMSKEETDLVLKVVARHASKAGTDPVGEIEDVFGRELTRSERHIVELDMYRSQQQIIMTTRVLQMPGKLLKKIPLVGKSKIELVKSIKPVVSAETIKAEHLTAMEEAETAVAKLNAPNSITRTLKEELTAQVGNAGSIDEALLNALGSEKVVATMNDVLDRRVAGGTMKRDAADEIVANFAKALKKGNVDEAVAALPTESVAGLVAEARASPDLADNIRAEMVLRDAADEITNADRMKGVPKEEKRVRKWFKKAAYDALWSQQPWGMRAAGATFKGRHVLLWGAELIGVYLLVSAATKWNYSSIGELVFHATSVAEARDIIRHDFGRDVLNRDNLIFIRTPEGKEFYRRLVKIVPTSEEVSPTDYETFVKQMGMQQQVLVDPRQLNSIVDDGEKLSKALPGLNKLLKEKNEKGLKDLATELGISYDDLKGKETVNIGDLIGFRTPAWLDAGWAYRQRDMMARLFCLNLGLRGDEEKDVSAFLASNPSIFGALWEASPFWRTNVLAVDIKGVADNLRTQLKDKAGNLLYMNANGEPVSNNTGTLYTVLDGLRAKKTDTDPLVAVAGRWLASESGLYITVTEEVRVKGEATVLHNAVLGGSFLRVLDEMAVANPDLRAPLKQILTDYRSTKEGKLNNDALLKFNKFTVSLEPKYLIYGDPTKLAKLIAGSEIVVDGRLMTMKTVTLPNGTTQKVPDEETVAAARREGLVAPALLAQLDPSLVWNPKLSDEVNAFHTRLVKFAIANSSQDAGNVVNLQSGVYAWIKDSETQIRLGSAQGKLVGILSDLEQITAGKHLAPEEIYTKGNAQSHIISQQEHYEELGYGKGWGLPKPSKVAVSPAAAAAAEAAAQQKADLDELSRPHYPAGKGPEGEYIQPSKAGVAPKIAGVTMSKEAENFYNSAAANMRTPMPAGSKPEQWNNAHPTLKELMTSITADNAAKEMVYRRVIGTTAADKMFRKMAGITVSKAGVDIGTGQDAKDKILADLNMLAGKSVKKK